MRNDKNNEQRSSDQDMLRDNTMNEMIREVGAGSPDADLNNMKETDDDTGNMGAGTGTRGGVNYTPQDASGVRSGGTTDMDDQAAGGAGYAAGRRLGSGSRLAPKTGRTGSDYDGQNSTS